MFFDGAPQKGVCPAGGGHVAQGFGFVLPHDVPETGSAQAAWRFCPQCFGMFFDGAPQKGVCPAGGGHVAQGFGFVLPHDVPETGTAQAAWRFCPQCFGMFFDGSPDKGVCPAGRGHVAQGFVFVLPHRGAPGEPPPVTVWTDSLRCHSETPGFGIGEGDEPFVIAGVIDLENRTPIGTPTTNAVLYGPLDGVDDQENHSFAFQPFWNSPLRMGSVVFVAAAVEHDNVNPDVTRSAAAAALQAVALATLGAPVDRIESEAVSAMSAAVEPLSGPGVVNRLIGPPAILRFGPDDIALAESGGTARFVHRFSGFGDYSVHFLARRS